MNEDEVWTKNDDLNRTLAINWKQKANMSQHLDSTSQNHDPIKIPIKLSLPWPRKNTPALRKPKTAAINISWTFLNSIEDDCKLAFDSKVLLTVRSLRQLVPGMMVNDEVVNASFQYLGEKMERRGRKIKIFNSFFFTTLHGNQDYNPINYNFQAIKRWTKPSRLPGKYQTVFELDLIVFPIFLRQRQHWVCGVIVNKERCNPEFFLFNSDVLNREYDMDHLKILSSITRWWRDEYTTRVGGLTPPLRTTVVKNIPQQSFCSNDCGPFSYAYASLACLVSPQVSQWPRCLNSQLLRDMMLCKFLRKSKKFRNYKKDFKN